MKTTTRNALKAAAVGVAALTLTACGNNAPATPATHDVAYYATGTMQSAIVTIIADDTGAPAAVQQKLVALPMRDKTTQADGIHVTMTYTDYAYITVSNNTGHGIVGCSLAVDGKTVATDTSPTRALCKVATN